MQLYTHHHYGSFNVPLLCLLFHNRKHRLITMWIGRLHLPLMKFNIWNNVILWGPFTVCVSYRHIRICQEELYQKYHIIIHTMSYVFNKTTAKVGKQQTSHAAIFRTQVNIRVGVICKNCNPSAALRLSPDFVTPTSRRWC